jgi:hypothetical protein
MNGSLIVMLPALAMLVGVIGIVGLLYNKFNKSGKKFNWKAAFLAPWYYAQYGRWGLGLLFGFLYMIPLLGIIVAIYTGIRADTDLPKSKSDNALLYVILVSFWMVLLVYSQIR